MATEIALLLRLMDQAFDQRAWHGTTLAGSLRGVSAKQAAWRPNPKRHNIWELVLHTAYWKYATRRRLTGEKRGSFAREGSNWLPLPGELSERNWKADVRLLKEEHKRLRGTVAALSAKQLNTRTATGEWRNSELIHGVAAHDLYHTGQIQLLKRLQR